MPHSLKGRVLDFCHNSLFGAHLGVRKTISQIKRRFHWPRMGEDVKTHVRTCATCQANKGPLLRYRAALADFRVGAPMDRVVADVMGPFPLSRQENRYIFVLVDYFTRWVEAFPLPNQRAETVAQKVVMDFICRFGAPLELHTDQGRNFESTLFGEVCKLLEIHKTGTNAYHPSTNGLVERFNRTLASMIRSYVDSSTEDWDLYIPVLTSAYRGTVHPATGFTPNFLMLGRETTMPIDMHFPQLHPYSSDIPTYVVELEARLIKCYHVARENLRRAAERQQKVQDTRISQNTYSPGQAVTKRAPQTSKLTLPWVGPYIVTKVLSDCVYVIADKKKTYAVHHDRLKPCQSETCPSWAQKLQAAIVSK